jgi:hypothetical protein
MLVAMSTEAKLINLIKADLAAGKKVEWLEIDKKDRADLIDEIRKRTNPLSRAMKANGIDVALPKLNGVPLRWNAATTKTKLRASAK